MADKRYSGAAERMNAAAAYVPQTGYKCADRPAGNPGPEAKADMSGAFGTNANARTPEALGKLSRMNPKGLGPGLDMKG